MENYFAELNSINVNDHVEKKNGLSYLSWAWCWAEVKKIHPDAQYTIYENANGLFYHTDGKTCWVKTGVTVNGIEHIEYLPVMDYRNASIPADKVTSFDVNKAIQRSLTKACARHGLGLYIYAGEDLPEEDQKDRKDFEKSATAEKRAETIALKKAIKNNTPYEKPKSNLSIEARFIQCMKWLNTLTEWNISNSQRDAINNLLADLFEADNDKYAQLKKIVDDKDNLTDSIQY